MGRQCRENSARRGQCSVHMGMDFKILDQRYFGRVRKSMQCPKFLFRDTYHGMSDSRFAKSLAAVHGDRLLHHPVVQNRRTGRLSEKEYSSFRGPATLLTMMSRVLSYSLLAALAVVNVLLDRSLVEDIRKILASRPPPLSSYSELQSSPPVGGIKLT